MRSCAVSVNQQLSCRFLSFHSLHLVANLFPLLCSISCIFLLFVILFGFVLIFPFVILFVPFARLALKVNLIL